MPPVTTRGRSPARLVGPCHWARQTLDTNRLLCCLFKQPGVLRWLVRPEHHQPGDQRAVGRSLPPTSSQRLGAESETTGRALEHTALGGSHWWQFGRHASAAMGGGFPRLGGALHCARGSAGLTAQNIAFNEIARHAILSDPDWCHGDYLAQGKLPTRGVALARWSGTSPTCRQMA